MLVELQYFQSGEKPISVCVAAWVTWSLARWPSYFNVESTHFAVFLLRNSGDWNTAEVKELSGDGPNGFYPEVPFMWARIRGRLG